MKLDKALEFCRNNICADYIWGGEGPGYDCSGFVRSMLRYCEFPDLPKYDFTARDIPAIFSKYAKPFNSITPGSLVLFGSPISHVVVCYRVTVVNGKSRPWYVGANGGSSRCKDLISASEFQAGVSTKTWGYRENDRNPTIYDLFSTFKDTK